MRCLIASEKEHLPVERVGTLSISFTFQADFTNSRQQNQSKLFEWHLLVEIGHQMAILIFNTAALNNFMEEQLKL